MKIAAFISILYNIYIYKQYNTTGQVEENIKVLKNIIEIIQGQEKTLP